MNDITQALAYLGAFTIGVVATLGLIYYVLFVRKPKSVEIDQDAMAMAEAIGVVQAAMPGSTILRTETH